MQILTALKAYLSKWPQFCIGTKGPPKWSSIPGGYGHLLVQCPCFGIFKWCLTEIETVQVHQVISRAPIFEETKIWTSFPKTSRNVQFSCPDVWQFKHHVPTCHRSIGSFLVPSGLVQIFRFLSGVNSLSTTLQKVQMTAARHDASWIILVALEGRINFKVLPCFAHVCCHICHESHNSKQKSV